MFGPIEVVNPIRFFEAKGVSRKCPSCGHETCDLIDEARADVHFALPGLNSAVTISVEPTCFVSSCLPVKNAGLCACTTGRSSQHG